MTHGTHSAYDEIKEQPKMSNQETDEILQRLIHISHEMISLADHGDELRQDATCGVLYGRLRDAGYDLRNLARRELEEHRLEDPDTATRTDRRSRHVVLIVDDESDIVTFLSRWFQDLGCRTVSASNGFEAIELAITQRPDLITLDMSMPEKSGVSTYRDLKGDSELCRIPIIILTGIGRAQEDFLRTRTPLPEPDGFIPKPIDMNLLEETVGRLLH